MVVQEVGEGSILADPTLADLLAHADGVLLATELEPHDAQYLERMRIPCVHVFTPTFTATHSTCFANEPRGALEAVRHLVELGHRRIGYLTAGIRTNFSEERRMAWLAVQADAGLTVRPEYCLRAEHPFYGEQAGYEAMGQLLALAERPTAVFCANDSVAVGAMRLALERGLGIPRDLSVVGYDDMDFARFTRPPLTTVRQDMELRGRLAAAELIWAICDPSYVPHAVVLPTQLVVRGSTAEPGR
jgi:LacI family transcriptional regulator